MKRNIAIHNKTLFDEKLGHKIGLQFWPQNFRPICNKGDEVSFYHNAIFLGSTKITEVASPGNHPLDSTNKFNTKWKIIWDMEQFQFPETKPLVPNVETVEALKAAEAGELISVGSVSELFKDLEEKDE